MDQIITTAAERAAASDTGLTGAQVDQLTGLLRAAAELERAKRPVIIASGNPVVVTPTGHMPPPGFSGAYPSAAEFEGVPPWAPLRRPLPVRLWGVRCAYVGIAAALAGAAAAVDTDGSGAAVGVIVAGLAAVAAGTVRAYREENMQQES